MFNNKYQYLLNSSHMSRIDKRSLQNYICVRHCAILFFIKLLLLMILNKVCFDFKIFHFFSSYLINRQTQYIWNYFIFLFFKANIDVGQESVLFILLFFFYTFEKKTKNLSTFIPVLILLFVDDGLCVSQEKSYDKSNTTLFCSYNIILSLFN